MNRLITRGMGDKQLLITRGLAGLVGPVWREILRLKSAITTTLRLESRWKKQTS